MLLLLATLALAAPDPTELCPKHPGTWQLLYAEAGTFVFYGHTAEGVETLLQTRAPTLPEWPRECQTWRIGEPAGSALAHMVEGAEGGQVATLHRSDPASLTGVVVVREPDGDVVAAGPFFLFCEAPRMERLDLGDGSQRLVLSCIREDARHQGDGLEWADAASHLLGVRQGLVEDQAKSVVLAARYSDGEQRCEAVPDWEIEVVERGDTPRIRVLDDPDPRPRAPAGEAEVGAWTMVWSPELSTFVVAPPHRRERVRRPVLTGCPRVVLPEPPDVNRAPDELDTQAFHALWRPRDLHILDVRPPDQTARGVVPGARLIPLGQLEHRVVELDGWQPLPVFVYGEDEAHTRKAVRVLKRHGFTDLSAVVEGWKGWEAAGYEVAQPRER